MGHRQAAPTGEGAPEPAHKVDGGLLCHADSCGFQEGQLQVLERVYSLEVVAGREFRPRRAHRRPSSSVQLPLLGLRFLRARGRPGRR